MYLGQRYVFGAFSSIYSFGKILLSKVKEQCKDLLNLYLRTLVKIYVQIISFRCEVLMFCNQKLELLVGISWFKLMML